MSTAAKIFLGGVFLFLGTGAYDTGSEVYAQYRLSTKAKQALQLENIAVETITNMNKFAVNPKNNTPEFLHYRNQAIASYLQQKTAEKRILWQDSTVVRELDKYHR